MSDKYYTAYSAGRIKQIEIKKILINLALHLLTVNEILSQEHVLIVVLLKSKGRSGNDGLKYK